MTHCIRVLDRSGDTVVAEWSDTDRLSQEVADRKFQELVDNGMLLTAPVDAPGSGKAVQLKEFDPAAREIVAHRPMMGG